jgi:hypothetical protein
MLLHGQRPQHDIGSSHAEKGCEIGKVDCAQAEKGARRVMRDCQNQQDQIIGRQNAEGAPDIKPLEIIGAVNRVEQQSGNQESGQDKEQVHAKSAGPRRVHKKPRHARQHRHVISIKGVIDEYHQNGGAANGIELRHDVAQQRFLVRAGKQRGFEAFEDSRGSHDSILVPCSRMKGQPAQSVQGQLGALVFGKSSEGCRMDAA